MSIREQLNKVKASLPAHVTLVAVSKTKPIEDLEEAYQAGQRVFGENKIQEMTAKWEALPKDISWHMIGHVQRNKVKYMASYVDLIHGVDSVSLLKEIDKQGAKHQRVIPCLLQVHIAREDTKFGFDDLELKELMESNELETLKHIKIKGLMGMASFTSEAEVVSKEFAHLKSLFDTYKSRFEFDTLSMGMSDDFPLAIDHGSTMVRVGSLIFGARFYKH